MAFTLAPSTPTEQLGEQIAELAARLHAATYQLLVLLRQFDEQLGWSNGFLSCAHWLNWRTGIDLGAAREKVRVARALVDLPLISGAMRDGQVSYAKVRALTRIATPQNEQRLLDLALNATASQVERTVRAWRRCDRVVEAQTADRRHLHRSVTTYVDDDGMFVLRARLTPELGAIVQRALDAASDQLYREAKDAAPSEAIVEEITSAQRRADALGRLAECALSSRLDEGGASNRYQVVLHVDTEPDGTEHAVMELADGGVHVSAETSRRLSCDASIVTVTEAPSRAPLDVGRKTRTVPTAIRRALDARDRHCRFPGCTSRRCDAHHITHWAAGGATSLDNLVLLCRRHHRLVHEGGLRVERNTDDAVTFIRPNGRRVEVAPPLRAGGILPQGLPPAPCWDGSPFSLAHVLDVTYIPPSERA